jgi:hypothetical protein
MAKTKALVSTEYAIQGAGTRFLVDISTVTWGSFAQRHIFRDRAAAAKALRRARIGEIIDTRSRALSPRTKASKKRTR